jgi:hypothetical protein
MGARIPADGERESQPAGVGYPTPAGADAFRSLCRGRPDRRFVVPQWHAACRKPKTAIRWSYLGKELDGTAGREAAHVAYDRGPAEYLFFKTPGATLRQAKTQIDAFDANGKCKKIAYVIINYDDSLHEYGGPNRMQIEQYLALDHPAPSLNVELDIKEPFYTAMS